jgi:hypothetical protein
MTPEETWLFLISFLIAAGPAVKVSMYTQPVSEEDPRKMLVVEVVREDGTIYVSYGAAPDGDERADVAVMMTIDVVVAAIRNAVAAAQTGG